MTARERLPNRRACKSFEFTPRGARFYIGRRFYADGRIAEIFLSSHKPGSPIEAIAECSCHGVDRASIWRDLETMRSP